MAIINNPTGMPLNEHGKIAMPPTALPSFRAQLAVQRGLSKEFLIYVVGGLGDAICAEPAIRWAMNNFKDCNFTIATHWPEIFQHLKAKGFIDFKKDNKGAEFYYNQYYVVRTLYQPDHLHSEFIPHMFTHVIDYASISMWRTQLSEEDRNIVLIPTQSDADRVQKILQHLHGPTVVIHPGQTWASRTIPAWFWDQVIDHLIAHGIYPVIIGGKPGINLGTVELRANSFIDLREELSIMESVYLLQNANVLLTNDSSPLHMASSSGNAFIGMFSTVKNPEFLLHVRDGQRGHRMHNFIKNGMWKNIDLCPTTNLFFQFNECTDEQMNDWLPTVTEVVQWTKWCLK